MLPRASFLVGKKPSKTFPRSLFDALFDTLFGAEKAVFCPQIQIQNAAKTQENQPAVLPYLARYLTPYLTLFDGNRKRFG